MAISSCSDEKLLLFTAHFSNMDEMSERLDLTQGALKVLAGFLDWEKISANYALDENFDEIVDWRIIVQTKKLTQCSLRKHLHRVPLTHMLKHQAFSDTLLRESLKNNTDREIWDIVSGEQSLSEKFMTDFYPHLTKDILVRNQYLPPCFITKHIHDLPIELLIQYQMLPNKLLMGDFSDREWALISRYQNLSKQILTIRNTKIHWGDLFAYNCNQDFDVVYKLKDLKTYCYHDSDLVTKVYNRSLRLLNTSDIDKLIRLSKKYKLCEVDLSWQPNIHPSSVTDWDSYVKWHPITVDCVETYKRPKSAYIFQHLTPSFIAHLTEDESLYQKNLKILFKIFEQCSTLDKKAFISLKHDLIQGEITPPCLHNFKLLLPTIQSDVIQSAFDYVDVLFFKLTHGIGEVKARELLKEKKKFRTRSDQHRAILRLFTPNQKEALQHTMDLITPIHINDYDCILTYLETELTVVGANNNKNQSYTEPVVTIINWQSGFPGCIDSKSDLLHTEYMEDNPMTNILNLLQPSIIHMLATGPSRSIFLLRRHDHTIKVICYNIVNTYMGCLYLFHKPLYDFIILNKTRFNSDDDDDIDLVALSSSFLGKYESYINTTDLCNSIPHKNFKTHDITTLYNKFG
jgi:hypothetical protein